MKTNLILSASVFLLTSLTACSSKQKGDTSYLDASSYAETSYDNSIDEGRVSEGSINVSYTEMAGNTITIPVKLNGMNLDMIYDTGASATMITVAEAKYLYDKGSLTENDFLDLNQYQIANGEIMTGLRINLKNVDIGDKIHLENIVAVVVENQQAPLLLGQSVMKKFKEISVDRDNKVVKFFR
jgi:aspartyl protease family protein